MDIWRERWNNYANYSTTLLSKEQNLIIVDNITVEVAGKKKGHYELELKWIDCIYTHVKQEKKKKKKERNQRNVAQFSLAYHHAIFLWFYCQFYGTHSLKNMSKKGRVLKE